MTPGSMLVSAGVYHVAFPASPTLRAVAAGPAGCWRGRVGSAGWRSSLCFSDNDGKPLSFFHAGEVLRMSDKGPARGADPDGLVVERVTGIKPEL